MVREVLAARRQLNANREELQARQQSLASARAERERALARIAADMQAVAPAWHSWNRTASSWNHCSRKSRPR